LLSSSLLLRNPVADFTLSFVHSGLPIASRDHSCHSIDAGELARTASNWSGRRGRQITCLRALNCHQRASSEELIAVLEDVYTVGSRLSAIIGVVGDTPSPRFHDLHPADHGRIGWINALNLEDTYLMAGNVANINRVLLGVLGILCADSEDKPLLGYHRICWQGDSQAHQCNSP